MSESLNHSFNPFVQNTNSFRNNSWVSHWIIHSTHLFKALIHSGTTHEWVIESFIPPIRSKQWFIQEQLMSESLNHSFHRFVQNSGSFRNNLWVSHWIIHSTDSFKTVVPSGTNHEWVIESFIPPIRSKQWFIQEQIMSESLNHSFNRFVQNSGLFRNKSWVSHWIIHSTDSFNHASSTVYLICPSNKNITILNYYLNIFYTTSIQYTQYWYCFYTQFKTLILRQFG